MSQNVIRQIAPENARIHARLEDALGQAVGAVHETDRTFELPVRLHVITAALYLGFVAVMGLGFANPEMVIPLAIFGLFIAAFFGVPALWARMNPPTASRALRWSEFRRDGIASWTGRLTARDASVQVLILPVLILCWGIACVVIAAVVR
jgi:hypothetical protein